MAEIEGHEGIAKHVGGHDVQSSRPSLDFTSTNERRASGVSANFARAPSERRSSVSGDSGLVLRRGSSIGSAQIQPLPGPAMPCDEAVDAGNLPFNPIDLLQEGLGEWQDRASSLQTLKKCSSISASKCNLWLEQTPLSGAVIQRPARHSLDSYGGSQEYSRLARRRYSAGGIISLFFCVFRLNNR